MAYLVRRTVKDTGFRGCKLSPEPQGDLYWGLMRGHELSDELRRAVPKTLVLGHDMKKEPSGILGMSTPPVFFSRELKEKLEEIEPGVHEFFPVNVVREHDGFDYGEYFLVHVTKKLDALVYEKTRFHAMGEQYGLEAARESAHSLSRFIGGVGKKGAKEDPCTLRATVIKGHHLWRGKVPDETFFNPGKKKYGVPPYDPMAMKFFVSDELHDFIKKEKKIEGWDFFSCYVE